MNFVKKQVSMIIPGIAERELILDYSQTEGQVHLHIAHITNLVLNINWYSVQQVKM